MGLPYIIQYAACNYHILGKMQSVPMYLCVCLNIACWSLVQYATYISRIWCCAGKAKTLQSYFTLRINSRKTVVSIFEFLSKEN
jgi:hypothetical protein